MGNCLIKKRKKKLVDKSVQVNSIEYSENNKILDNFLFEENLKKDSESLNLEYTNYNYSLTELVDEINDINNNEIYSISYSF